MISYSYAGDGLIASMRVERLQLVFHFLMDLFDWLVLCINVSKTVSIVCQTCRAIGGHSMEAYGLQMTDEGSTHKEQLLLCIRCPECETDLSSGYLEIHWQVQHRLGRGYMKRTLPPPPHPTPGRALGV